MNKGRPTNRDILDMVESMQKSTQISLIRMDEKILQIGERQKEMKKEQLKGTSVLLWIAGSIASTVALTFTIIQAL